MIKKGTLCMLRDQKGHIYCLPSPPPPPPTHTHTPKRFYIPCLFIVFAPLPIQHSFLCSFKWMSLLKPVPQPKKILYLMFPVHLYDLCSSQNLALFCSLISKKMSLFPKMLGRKYVKREINVTVIAY